MGRGNELGERGALIDIQRAVMLDDCEDSRGRRHPTPPHGTTFIDRCRRLADLAVGFDPAYSLANDQPKVLPQALIVDPSTMRIVARVYGNVGIQSYIDGLVAENE